MSITIRDVAEKLGLSIATVSRALDGYPDIALKTRQRVQQAAQEMGYTPNRAARQLRRKKADAIGYILPASIPRFADPFYVEFIAGLGDETALHPYDLLVSIAPPGEQAEQKIYTNWVQSRKVDGFVIDRRRHQDWRVQFLCEHGVPFAALEHGWMGTDYPYVQIDNLSGMASLVAHLAQRGWRRMAFIGGPKVLSMHSQRLEGFRKGLEEVGLPFDAGWVLPGELTRESGFRTVKAMHWDGDAPDALVCINDETALGALHGVFETGLRVGQEVAISGFDGVQAAQYADPPLTTVDIPIYQIARKLVQLLVAEMRGEPAVTRQVVIVPRLVIRQST